VDRRLADAGKAGIPEAVLEATFDLTTAVMAGIGQSMHQRYKASLPAEAAQDSSDPAGRDAPAT